MNWLYPRTALDMLFPGLLWYIPLWIVLSFVVTGVLLWNLGVWVYKTAVLIHKVVTGE